MAERPHSMTRGYASQFFVAGELCRRGLVAVVTNGNCPNTDILVSDVAATAFVHVQVKTFVPGNTTVTVGEKAEKDYGPNFFWVLGGIPAVGSDRRFVYFVIPSGEMSLNVEMAHRAWLDKPGLRGQAHNPTSMRTLKLPPLLNLTGWDLSQYENRFDLIEDRLALLAKSLVTTPS